ncbi:MAG: STM3941 family protein [Flavitalea sp.]
MNTDQPIEIPLNKTKLIMMLVASIVFVAIGFWFVFSPPVINNSFWGNPTRLMIIGYASILFFGICTIALAKKLPDTKPGLIIDNKYLFDNSSALSVGEIPWEDIEHISVMEVQKQKMLMVEVRNPEEYIDRQPNFLKRKAMTMNYRMYGTPISITTNGLKIPFPELLDLLNKKYQEFRAGDIKNV